MGSIRGPAICFLVLAAGAGAGALSDQPPAANSISAADPPQTQRAEAEGSSTSKQRYTVLSAGHAAGFMETRTTIDGVRTIHFEFNDRGRGPSLDERITLGAGGVPAQVVISGVDYFKNEVIERFSIESGRASWKNPSEEGQKEVRGPAWYVGLNGVPEESALLASALKKAPEGRLALLPEGEAAIQEVGKITLTAGGRSEEITQTAISGLGFTPQTVWLDGSGRFFAQGSGFFTVIREGWESAQDRILEAQDAAAAKRLGDLAASLRRAPGRPIVLRDGDLFDPSSLKVVPHTTVVISGNRIRAVGPEGTVDVPRDAEVIAAAGKTILPGLWDMHVHTSDEDGILHLAAGVTTVRDLANDTDELLRRRQRYDDGTLAGPRIVMAGIIDGPGPYAGPTKVLVADEKEARAAVDRYAELGYAQVKIYSSVKPELVPAIVREARAKGLRVSGHVPAFMTAEQVVRAGYDEIQHANFLFLNFWADTVKDTRTPSRFTEVAEKAGSLDLHSEAVQSFVRLLHDKGTVLDPTLAIFESLMTARPGSVDPCFAAVAARMPAQVRRGFLTGGLPVPEGKDGTYRASFEAMLSMIKMMHDAGVPIVSGTDSLAGFALHRELELHARAGIPAPEVLASATLGAARIMKLDKDLGSVEAGKLADVILVDGRPAESIDRIRRVTLVVKDGAMYDPAALLRAAGIQAAPAGAP